MDYVVVNVPFNGRVARHHNSVVLSDESIAWLEENVGPGTLSAEVWSIGFDEKLFAWCYLGVTHNPTDYSQNIRVFYIRDADKAQLFSAAWGEQ